MLHLLRQTRLVCIPLESPDCGLWRLGECFAGRLSSSAPRTAWALPLPATRVHGEHLECCLTPSGIQVLPCTLCSLLYLSTTWELDFTLFLRSIIVKVHKTFYDQLLQLTSPLRLRANTYLPQAEINWYGAISAKSCTLIQGLSSQARSVIYSKSRSKRQLRLSERPRDFWILVCWAYLEK